MTDEAKKARREYQRAWERANKDKRKAINAKYWKRKAEQLAQNTQEVQETQGV